YNFDLPTAINREAFFQDIKQLFEGNTVHRQEYTFNNPNRTPKLLEINPAPILIVEGLFIFHYKEVNDLLDYRIFLEADGTVTFDRGSRRDLAESGYDRDDFLYKWIHHVVPAYEQYLLPFKPACDLVIINNTDDPKTMDNAAREICNTLRER